MSNIERDELARAAYLAKFPCHQEDAAADWDYIQKHTLHPDKRALVEPYRTADAILAAGYRKPRTVGTASEANQLPDRSLILTPGKIAFQKWEDYYGDGKDAWERELGQFVPAELLSDSDHFPAIVLYEPQP